MAAVKDYNQYSKRKLDQRDYSLVIYSWKGKGIIHYSFGFHNGMVFCSWKHYMVTVNGTRYYRERSIFGY